jgi:acyl-CoA synthetase (NDP forming)
LADDLAMGTKAHPLEYIFHPRSVAVVGATSASYGDQFVGSLREIGFPGPIYPVNPKADEIMGLRCYPSVREIPEPVDHVISSVSATRLREIIEDCGARGVKVIHLFTSGFGESGQADRQELEQWVVRRARDLGMRIIGPNCMGLYVPASGLTFTYGFPREPGTVALISQSGANAGEFVHTASLFGLRFSKVISYGNASDLNESDFLEYCAQDRETEIIAAYVEGVKDGRRFFRALKKAADRKPVIILKGGRTEAGGRAAQSHTASLAGSAQVFDTLCRQAGALQVSSLEELEDVTIAFRFAAPLPGPAVGVVMEGGGRSVLSADDLTLGGLTVPTLPDEAQAELRQFTFLAGTSVRNPVDTSATWIGGDKAADLLAETIRVVASAPNIDFVLSYEGLQWGPPTPGASPDAQVRRMEEILNTVVEKSVSLAKPVIFALRPTFSPEAIQATLRFQQTCYRHGIAVFPDIGRAAVALSKLFRWQESHREQATSR